MDEAKITLAEFTAIVSRAGLRLSSDDIAMLFGEIAVSCDIVRAMTGRIRARLSAASEPAQVFRREPGHDAS